MVHAYVDSCDATFVCRSCATLFDHDTYCFILTMHPCQKKIVVTTSDCLFADLKIDPIAVSIIVLFSSFPSYRPPCLLQRVLKLSLNLRSHQGKESFLFRPETKATRLVRVHRGATASLNNRASGILEVMTKSSWLMQG